MAKKTGGIDYGAFKEWNGRLYNAEGYYASPAERKGYEAYIKKLHGEESRTTTKGRIRTRNVAPRAQINERYFKYFPKSLQYTKAKERSLFNSKIEKDHLSFRNRGGHVSEWAKTLTLKGGPDANYGWRRASTRDFNGKIGSTSSKEQWGVRVDKGGEATILNGTKDWIKQLQIANHQLHIQVEHYRIMATHRAIDVFQKSFKYQKFFSQHSDPWDPLKPWTLKKRAAWGTGSKTLSAFGNLSRSIQYAGPGLVETRPVVVSTVWPLSRDGQKRSGKRERVVYAALHNEGFGFTGPKHNQPFKQRQFMGHSTYLDPMADKFMSQMLKRYLFDSVFMMRKK